jgi:hypothetical protein
VDRPYSGLLAYEGEEVRYYIEVYSSVILWMLAVAVTGVLLPIVFGPRWRK